MRAARVVALVAVAAALGPAPAAAHAVPAFTVALTVHASALGLEITHTVPRGAAARELRERFDADADGSLSASEREALSAFLLARTTATIVVTIDGGKPSFASATSTLDVRGDVAAPLRFTFAASAPVKWPRGAAQLAVDARFSDARAEAEVSVVVAPRARRSASSAGGVASRGAPFVVEIVPAMVRRPDEKPREGLRR